MNATSGNTGHSTLRFVYAYDNGGNRTSMLHHGGGVTATYAYDTRERCTKISKDGSVLADYPGAPGLH